MGADLILYTVPACGMTDDRRKVLSDLIEATSLEDTPEWYDNADDYKGQLSDAIKHYEQANKYRDTALIRMEGALYPSWFTGGMSWGDVPTESCDEFSLLSDHNPIMTQLRLWAIEDAD